MVGPTNRRRQPLERRCHCGLKSRLRKLQRRSNSTSNQRFVACRRCRCQCQSRQGWKRFGAHLLHDRRPVVLNGALAEIEVGGDILAGCPARTMSMTWRCRDVSLPRRSEASRRQADSLVVSCASSSARATLASNSSRPTGFSMKSVAPAFMAWTAIGTSLFPVIMMDGKREPPSATAVAVRGRSFPASSHPPGGILLGRHYRLRGTFAGRELLDEPPISLQ